MNEDSFLDSDQENQSADPFQHPAPAFCGQCGAPLPEDGQPCPRCSLPGTPVDSSVPYPARAPGIGAGAIGLPILFYFSLLVPSLLLAVSIGDDPLLLEKILSWLTVGVTLLFAICLPRMTFSGFRTIGPLRFLLLAAVGPLGSVYIAALNAELFIAMGDPLPENSTSEYERI